MTEQKKNGNEKPLVSVGMPIRNGAKTLEMAIQSVVNQTYSNLEIIISNNDSEDATAEICQRFARKDKRITYYSQAEPLTAIENFRFVFERSHGRYFMWAAHDDLRSENYVETLIHGFDKFPSAAIIISDVISFYDHNDLKNGIPLDYNFNTTGLSLIRKLRISITGGCDHLYGLINSNHLHGYHWYPLTLGPDRPLILYLLAQGDFGFQPGATLYKWKPASSRDVGKRALENAFKKPESFLLTKLSWCCMKAIKDAESKSQKPRNRLSYFGLFIMIYLFYALRKNTVKEWIYSHSPSFMRSVWERSMRQAKKSSGYKNQLVIN